MRLYLVITILLFFAPFLSFGQMGASIPSEKSKTFGFSLEKYKSKKQKSSQESLNSGKSHYSEVVQVKTDLVTSDILVTDQNGNIVIGLKKDDFIVMEDGEPQTIEMFSFGENLSSSRSIVLIIDTGITQLPYLKSSIQSAKTLIDKLKPNDKMAIVSHNINLLADFTKDKVLLKKVLDSITVKYSELSNGREFTNLLTVLNELFSEEDKHQIIISQGSGNGIFNIKTDDETLAQTYKSFLESRGVKEDWKKYIEFRDIEEAIEKSRVTIYSIIPGIRMIGLPKKEQFSRAQTAFKNIRQSFDSLRGGNRRITGSLPSYLLDLETKRQIFVQIAMSKVADLSGGYTSFLENLEDVGNIYDNIFNDFSNRYSIGYYLTNQKQDGRRTIKIEVKNHPEYKILGRKTYILEK